MELTYWWSFYLSAQEHCHGRQNQEWIRFLQRSSARKHPARQVFEGGKENLASTSLRASQNKNDTGFNNLYEFIFFPPGAE
jgi:hypothetical protein